MIADVLIGRLWPGAREVEACREAAQALAPAAVRSLVPSSRSLAVALGRQREWLERVPLLDCARQDLVQVGAALDQAEVGALGVLVSDPAAELPQLARLSAELSVPLLRCDLVLDERQVYETRAAGCDGLLLHAQLLGPQLARLVAAAQATHLAAAVVCQAPSEVALAAAARADLIALPCDEAIDPALLAAVPARALLLAVPRGHRTPDAAALRGRVDALLDLDLGLAEDPVAALRAALEAEEQL